MASRALGCRIHVHEVRPEFCGKFLRVDRLHLVYRTMILRTARVVELGHHLGALAEDRCNLAIRVIARIGLVYDLAQSRAGVEFDLLGEGANTEQEYGADY